MDRRFDRDFDPAMNNISVVRRTIRPTCRPFASNLRINPLLRSQISRYQSTQSTQLPPEQTNFTSAAQPRPIRDRPLPKGPKRHGLLLAATAAVGFAGWAVFLLYATNLERLSSSVTRQIITNLKHHSGVIQLLGTPIQLPPALKFFGDPWVSGSVNMPAGHVDLSFRVKGPKTGGTVYFTSVRKEKGVPFTILRFKLITDTGETLSLVEEQSQMLLQGNTSSGK